jgi:hypothetical protein
LFGSIHYATLIAEKGGVTMAVTDHDRKVGALLGLDPARIAENRRKAEERAIARGIQPMTAERLKEIGTGGPWESDEEFEEYLTSIYEQRGRVS